MFLVAFLFILLSLPYIQYTLILPSLTNIVSRASSLLRISVMDADGTIGPLGSLKADLIGSVSFDATYVYFNKVCSWVSVLLQQYWK